MISQAAILGQASGLTWMAQNLSWVVAAVIVILCLFVYGAGDVFRLSLMRIRAIASVCFRESIRRRVLWLTPMAIIGVLIVAQFQRPLDEQDAIRQVTKFCIFAAGILITISSVILACTSLPREIENRVIYTIVTKPTSRLEILMGKIAGFAGVSAAILLIMGLFTLGYLQVHEWRVLGDIDARLEAGDLEPSTEETLAYYKTHGLLDARRYVANSEVQVFADYPREGTNVRTIQGPGEQDALIPFVIGQDVLLQGASFGGVAVVLRMPWEQRPLTNDELLNVTSMAEQAGVKIDAKTPAGPGEKPATDVSQLMPAFFRVSFLNARMDVLADAAVIQGGMPLVYPDRTGQQQVQVPLTPEVAERLVNARQFYLRVSGASPGTRYVIDPNNFAFAIATEQGPKAIRSQQFDPATGAQVMVMGRSNQNGQQVAGNAEGKGAVGVFTFKKGASSGDAAQTAFEFRTIIERDADDLRNPMFANFRIVNKTSGQTSEPVRVAVESRRTAHFSLPAEFTKGGHFDVLVQALTPEQWLSIRPGTLRLSSPDQGFAVNLFKSLLILWFFSILVITVAIFCSTFLSWPIAFVLTLLILLGHWGVTQLGDLANPGVGRQIVSDLFAGAAPAVAETLNRSVEGLGSLLRLFAAVLPDISRFAAMEDIEQGVAISAARLIDPLLVLAMFGLPILALSYVFFRNKEVAP